MSAPIEVLEVRRLTGDGNLKAFAKVRLGAVVIHGCRVIKQPNQKPWMALPQVPARKGPESKGGSGWYPVIEITSPDLLARVRDAVLEAWETRVVSAFLKAPFGGLAPYLADYGYVPVPIKPGGKAPLIDDWQAGHPPEHYLPRCASWGPGLLTANTPAIDLDIRNKEVVRAGITLADELIGPAPFRIGQPPKALLPFSTSEPFEKVSGRWFALPGDNWTDAVYQPHRVEILGAGQQFVCYAKHPRGSWYRWRRGEPMQSYLVDLPALTGDLARAYVEAVEQVLLGVGAVPLRKQEGKWRPDAAAPAQDRPRYDRADPDTVRAWQFFDAETVAKIIDPRGARRTKTGWSCKCPVHKGIGNSSLGITIGPRGTLVVNCFAECDWREVGDEISRLVGGRAA